MILLNFAIIKLQVRDIYKSLAFLAQLPYTKLSIKMDDFYIKSFSGVDDIKEKCRSAVVDSKNP